MQLIQSIKCRAFTLVEMLVALAVSSIIIIASYASYEMVATQYKKNMDIADMHTSGRAIMRIIERDIRMAGFEYRDTDAKVTYGTISNPLTIKDSGNKCCDEVTVIYDYFDEEAKKAERISIRYWAEPYTSNKGSRHRLYKQKDILGRNGSVLANPALGRKEVMADYIEDLQIVNINNITNLYVLDSAGRKVYIFDPSTKKYTGQFDLGRNVGYFGMGADGNLYVLDSAGRKVYIFDPSTKKYTGQFDLGRNVGYFGMGADGNLYVLDSAGRKVYIFDPSTKKYTGQFDLGRNVGYFGMGADGNLYVLDSAGRKVYIFDPSTKKYTGQFDLGRNVGYFGMGADGNLYVLDSAGRKVYIFDPSTKKYTGQFDLGRNVGYFALRNQRTGQESLVTINLTLRTKNQYGKDRQFKKKDYHGGNFKIDKTDKYKRDTFSSTVLVRNLAL